MALKRTKIVCTIGPSSNTIEILEKMIRAGMNVARLNFSHGTHPDHLKLIRNIRKAAKNQNTMISILQDLQGPRIRLGDLPKNGIEVKDNEDIILTTGAKNKNKLPVTYKDLHKELKKDHRILIADGVYELKITKISAKDIYCKVIHGGTLLSHKGMNFPDSKISLAAITAKDKKDVEFGIKNNVDFVALSFVKSKNDVIELNDLINKLEKKHKIKETNPIKIIVKVEKHEAVKNFDSILKSCGGIMIARGDLGIEMPAEDVPILQKDFITKCLLASKPVIVATQMLDSMINNVRPTRAEVSDVANAVIDHTDAVMLSGESASGSYPIQTVSIMSRIIKKTEKSEYDDLEISEALKKDTFSDIISEIAHVLSDTVSAKLILVVSTSGYAARIVSKFRPELPIAAITFNERLARQLNLNWGIIPILMKKEINSEKLIINSLNILKNNKIIKKGDNIIIIDSYSEKVSNDVNVVKIHKIS